MKITRFEDDGWILGRSLTREVHGASEPADSPALLPGGPNQLEVSSIPRVHKNGKAPEHHEPSTKHQAPSTKNHEPPGTRKYGQEKPAKKVSAELKAPPKPVDAPAPVSRKVASGKISAIADGIYNDIVRKSRRPSMSFPVRSLRNVRYDTRRGHFEILGKKVTRTLSYTTVKTFAQSMRLLATTKNDLLDKDDIAGKREVYSCKSWGNAAR